MLWTHNALFKQLVIDFLRLRQTFWLVMHLMFGIRKVDTFAVIINFAFCNIGTINIFNASLRRVSLRFGNSNNGLNCGLSARNLNNAATNAWWNNGASLFCQKWKIN